MERYTYPHTIENGGGEKLTFLRKVKDENGEYLEIENIVQPGFGPPMHLHFKQAESLTVVKGKVGIQRLDGKEEFFGEGQSVTFEAGEAHRFWNPGTEPLHCTGWVKPADNLEYFLTQIYESSKENGGKGPNKFDGAYLLTRYRSEFEMFGIPTFVKKVIFPITVFIGHLTGKYKKFEDAPEAVG